MFNAALLAGHQLAGAAALLPDYCARELLSAQTAIHHLTQVLEETCESVYRF
jgi:hypothetical protein